MCAYGEAGSPGVAPRLDSWPGIHQAWHPPGEQRPSRCQCGRRVESRRPAAPGAGGRQPGRGRARPPTRGPAPRRSRAAPERRPSPTAPPTPARAGGGVGRPRRGTARRGAARRGVWRRGACLHIREPAAQSCDLQRRRPQLRVPPLRVPPPRLSLRVAVQPGRFITSREAINTATSGRGSRKLHAGGGTPLGPQALELHRRVHACRERRCDALGRHLHPHRDDLRKGFGRMVVSEIELPNCLADLVKSV